MSHSGRHRQCDACKRPSLDPGETVVIGVLAKPRRRFCGISHVFSASGHDASLQQRVDFGLTQAGFTQQDLAVLAQQWGGVAVADWGG